MKFEDYLAKVGKKIKETTMGEKCLSDEDIVFYFDGVLSDDERRRIEKHISLCGECRETLKEHAEIAGQIDDECMSAVPEHIIKKTVEMMTPLVHGRNLFDVVVRLKERALQVINTTGSILKGAVAERGDVVFVPIIGASLAGVSFRSEKKPENCDIAIRKEFSSIVLTAELNRSGQNSTDLTLHITGKDSSVKLSDIRVTMKKGARTYESALIKYGKKVFEDVTPGAYLIEVKDGGDNLMGSVKLDLTSDE